MSGQTIKYLELVDVDSLRTLMDSLSQVIGIANAIIDTDGVVITSSGWQDTCVKFHRVNPQTCINCIESDTSLVKSMLKGEDFAIYNCLNGLVDTAMPIVVDGQHVANVFTGQCFTEPPDFEFFRGQARQYGFDEVDYLDAIAKVPVLSRQRIEIITQVYAQIARMLASSGLVRLREKQATAELAKLNNELTRRVRDRTRELSDKNLQLQQEKQALADSEARLAALFENMSSGVAVYKPCEDGRNFMFTEFNQAAERIEKISRHLLIGKKLDEIFPNIDAFGLPEVLRRVAKTGQAESFPVSFYQDGRIQGWRDNYIYPLPSGEIVAIYDDVTERKQAEQALRDSEANLKAFFDYSPIGINVLDRNGKVLAVNRAAREMFGVAPDDPLERYCLFDDPAVLPETKAALRQGLSASEERFIDFQQIKRNRLYETYKSSDSRIFIHLAFSPCFTQNQELAGYIASIIDITERKQAEKKMQLTQFSVDCAIECIYWITADARFQFVNNTACQFLGYSREQLLTRTVMDIDPGFSREAWRNHWQQVKQRGSLQFESVHRTREGCEIPVEIAANYIVFDDCEYHCAFVRDIRERKTLLAELEHQAHFDYLTGIANRRHFMEQGEMELARAQRYGNSLSIFMLDIDHFKKINDSFGHAVGDKVLQKMGCIFAQTLREVDIPGRLGGEEFAVLLPETNSSKALEVAERLRNFVANTTIPLEAGVSLQFTICIGVATLREKISNIDSLLNLADKALYQAKDSGRNKVCGLEEYQLFRL
ncbi:Diguanylate cyclase DgcM [Methylococcales bacterium]|nr:Diguanylate cyclase DgcM [Methylococcales bacterium]